MKGKEKCKALKEIRRQIALKNDIEYAVSECTYQGDCKGTCPKCESELAYLEKQLAIRQTIGKSVAVVGLSIGLSTSLSACTSPIDLVTDIFDGGALSGDVQPTTGVLPAPANNYGSGENGDTDVDSGSGNNGGTGVGCESDSNGGTDVGSGSENKSGGDVNSSSEKNDGTDVKSETESNGRTDVNGSSENSSSNGCKTDDTKRNDVQDNEKKEAPMNEKIITPEGEEVIIQGMMKAPMAPDEEDAEEMLLLEGDIAYTEP